MTHAKSCASLNGNMLPTGNTVYPECDCDGYHTFKELYEHRFALFITVCMLLRLHTDAEIWRSTVHSDGSTWDGWFILGIGSNYGKQITYHLPIAKWDDTAFALTYERAPKWDGHTSDDVIQRLKTM